MKATLEKGPTERWIIGSNNVATRAGVSLANVLDKPRGPFDARGRSGRSVATRRAASRAVATPLNIYQLRVVLRSISPLVRRRLLVHSETTLAQLHTILQIGPIPH